VQVKKSKIQKHFQIVDGGAGNSIFAEFLELKISSFSLEELRIFVREIT